MSVLPEPVGAWIRTSPPVAIAGQPSVCAGVASANAPSNQARVAGEKAASGSIAPGYRPDRPTNKCSFSTVPAMPEALYFTDDEAPASCSRRIRSRS